MIIDILQTIINHCDIEDQLRCSKINSYTYDNLYI